MLKCNKSIIVLSFLLLLSLQMILQVHCTVEEPVSTPEEPAAGSSGGTGAKGGAGGGGGSEASEASEEGNGFAPYATLNSLGKPIEAGFCNLTPLIVNKTEYDNRCGPKSDPHWPCFKHEDNSVDDLSFVAVTPWFQPLNMTDELLLANASHFTLLHADTAFLITYRNSGGVSLRYYGYDHDTGCYNIHLEGTGSNRIHISTTDRDYRDVDTMNYKHTGKRLCNKSISIATRARDSWGDPKDDDNRGI